jgi:rhamnogalacturonan endolyase
MWSSKGKLIRSAQGELIDSARSLVCDTIDSFYIEQIQKYSYATECTSNFYPINFRIYFDGDLQDELLDGPEIIKPNLTAQTSVKFFDGAETLGLIGCNGTKNTPLLAADLFGDWREELILRTEKDPSKIYILSTPVTSPYRLYTLMHDAVYRTAVAWQNTAYNQPPHTSYYLPDMVKKFMKPSVYTVGDSAFTVYPDASLTLMGGKEKQTVTLGNSIKKISYEYMFCTGVKVEGLPSGVSAKVDSATQTVAISGKPKKTGTFKYTVKTVGSKAENATASGEIVVKEAEVVDTAKTDSSKTVPTGSSIVDAAYPDEGEGSTENESKGYIEKGYFDFKNAKSSYGTWLIKSAKASSTTMSVRFANGDSVARDMILVVNDEEIGTVKMDETGSWSAWNTFDIEITLKKGKNTITLKSTTKNGGADVDAFLFDIAGVESYTDKKSEALPVARLDGGFMYRPSTGTLFTSVPGFVEILFYDASGTMRGAVSGYVMAGESVLALERGVLPEGMYIVNVKLDGKVKQKSLFKR